jgi:hypothetical protein
MAPARSAVQRRRAGNRMPGGTISRVRYVPLADARGSRGTARAHIGRRYRRKAMIHAVVLQPLAALVAGILILILPRVLNYIVAIYLIIIGIIGLLGHG